jgi:chorismate mutase-like protein
MGTKRARGRLTAVRRRIDQLDERLLRLLNARARLALEVGRVKHRKKWPVYDPAREAFVLRHVARANRGPLSSAAIRRVFQAVLTQCRRREGDRKRRKGGRSP